MPQETFVAKLAPADQARLEQALAGGAFEHRRVPYARFSVKGPDFVATLYRSGKLVVQGSGVQLFAERYLPGVGESSKARRPAKALALGDGPLIGGDEAGKGDYFGPLVVAALRAGPEERGELARSGAADSKTLSDARIGVLAPALLGRYRCATRVLMPPDYNLAHGRHGNLNPLLAELHAECIRELARPGDAVLIDRFAREALIADRVADLDIDLHQETRAEREPVVAAASVIARHLFLEGLRELSEEFAVDLRKGAGAPTDAAAREFVRLHGRGALGRVAKLHFKNTSKIP